MGLEVTHAERDFLLEVLDARHTSLLRELHHTDSFEYKALLQEKIDLLERLSQKVKNLSPP